MNTSNEQTNLSVEKARSLICTALTGITETEKCSIKQSLGRVLAEDIFSTVNIPPYDNAAMDGYAFKYNPENENNFLEIIDTVVAGHIHKIKPKQNECIQIMTGAKIPDGCDTVIQQESAEKTNTQIKFSNKDVSPGDNIRLKGESLHIGEKILSKGKLLNAADTGLLASAGIAQISVFRKLRVAIISTGDELCEPGLPLENTQIYDCNRYSLHTMLSRLQCDITDLGIITDDTDTLKSALIDIAPKVDLIITSGGVSVGMADYTKEVINKIGDVNFWKINMRPGRPLAFGTIKSNGKNTIIFGLPGNPVAVMVGFYLFVQPAVFHMCNAETKPPLFFIAKAAEPFNKKSGRAEYTRGIIFYDESGTLCVKPTGEQGSAIMRSMSDANCFIVLDENDKSVNVGDNVKVIPLKEFRMY